MKLLLYNGVLRKLCLLVGQQSAMFEIDRMKHHEHAHAYAFEQIDRVEEHLFLIECPVVLQSAGDTDVDVEPADVWQCEKEGNDGVNAPLFPKIVLDFSELPHLSFDRSLGFHKQPDYKKEHDCTLD